PARAISAGTFSATKPNSHAARGRLPMTVVGNSGNFSGKLMKKSLSDCLCAKPRLRRPRPFQSQHDNLKTSGTPSLLGNFEPGPRLVNSKKSQWFAADWALGWQFTARPRGLAVPKQSQPLYLPLKLVDSCCDVRSVREVTGLKPAQSNETRPNNRQHVKPSLAVGITDPIAVVLDEIQLP